MQPYYYTSADVGAPVLNNANSSVLNLLRACGINGYNARSVVNIVVASGVAVATILDHGFSAVKAQLVRFEGAPEAGLNGDVQPTAVSTNTLTYAAPTVADGTYTGTITAKRAPFGLTEVFTGADVAVFGRAAPAATAMLLRVNDSAANGATATDARWISVESATDVDTWAAECPRAADVSGGYYINKGANTATAKNWVLMGCDVGFYLFTQLSTVDYYGAHEWIDLESYLATDPYGVLVSGTTTATVGGLNHHNFSLVTELLASTSTDIKWPRVQRDSSGVDTPVKCLNLGLMAQTGMGNTGPTTFATVPLQRPISVAERVGLNVHRGARRGLANPLANAPYSQKQIVTDAAGGMYVSLLCRYFGGFANVMMSLEADW